MVHLCSCIEIVKGWQLRLALPAGPRRQAVPRVNECEEVMLVVSRRIVDKLSRCRGQHEEQQQLEAFTTRNILRRGFLRLDCTTERRTAESKLIIDAVFARSSCSSLVWPASPSCVGPLPPLLSSILCCEDPLHCACTIAQASCLRIDLLHTHASVCDDCVPFANPEENKSKRKSPLLFWLDKLLATSRHGNK